MTELTPASAPAGGWVEPVDTPLAPAEPPAPAAPLPGRPSLAATAGMPVRPTPALDADDVAALLIGQSRSFSRSDVSRLSGVSVIGARKFWHALGFPDVSSRDRPYTEADLRALRRMATLVRAEVLDEDTALGLTRAFARTADRLAAWQVHLLAESLSARADAAGASASEWFPDDADAPDAGMPSVAPALRRLAGEDGSEDALDGAGVQDEATAQATARLLIDLADELEPMLVYAWRRHLNDALSRLLSDASPGRHSAGVVRCVGFADLVGFTTMVGQLTERELAHVVQRFESIASDVVTAHGGRVVKTVGDEVLFSTMAPAPGAAIALDLVDAIAEDSALRSVRVGVAYGSVVSRLGDVFGQTVNTAARLTPMAHPGHVLVDGALAKALASQPGFTLTPMRRRTLRGVGTVTPHTLVRSGSSATRGRHS